MFSNSVFSYFPGLRYAEEVLGRCLKIARHGIGLIDIHDPGKERDFIATRKSAIANYETLYKNLPKLFYKKSFFWDFAGKHNLDIVFMREDLNGYWNREFVFDVFLYEK
ncbi:MAG: hypothetical protein II837_11080 [Treponema sp.]|nr:hypothetical protein [Treponema sp.]